MEGWRDSLKKLSQGAEETLNDVTTRIQDQHGETISQWRAQAQSGFSRLREQVEDAAGALQERAEEAMEGGRRTSRSNLKGADAGGGGSTVVATTESTNVGEETTGAAVWGGFLKNWGAGDDGGAEAGGESNDPSTPLTGGGSPPGERADGNEGGTSSGGRGAKDSGMAILHKTRAVLQTATAKREPTCFEVYCCEMSKTERMMGFGATWAFGALMSIFSSLNAPAILTGHPDRFVIPYTMGIMSSMMGTLFLVGPWRQLKLMFDKTRRISAALYISLLFTSLILALRGYSLLCLVSVCVQYLAFLWYCLSYIPYGRRFVRVFWRRILSVFQKVCWPVIKYGCKCCGTVCGKGVCPACQKLCC